MSPVADSQPGCIDALFLESIQLLQQDSGIQYHTGSDDTDGRSVKNPGRYQVQREFPLVINHRMPGVVAPMGTDHDIRSLGKKIDNLAFALITPLAADYSDDSHLRCSPLTLLQHRNRSDCR